MAEIVAFEPLANWLETLVRSANSILDAGCGPIGSHWWPYKADAAGMVAVDLYNRPPTFPPHTDFIQADIATFGETYPFPAHFDLVVADHILEHVYDPDRVVFGFNRLLKTNRAVHIGVPDATNFTDRFYRLIHPDMGGHISLFTRQRLVEMLERAGFENVAIRPWGDDWGWFRRLYDWKARGIIGITQDDIEYIAGVFRKELTLEKGYFYGWEAVFIKREDLSIPAAAPVEQPAEPQLILPPKKAWQASLNEEELIELRWISQKTLRLKRTALYQLIKKLWGSK